MPSPVPMVPAAPPRPSLVAVGCARRAYVSTAWLPRDSVRSVPGAAAGAGGGGWGRPEVPGLPGFPGSGLQISWDLGGIFRGVQTW